MTAQVGDDLGLLTHLVDIADVDSTITKISDSGKPDNKYPGVCSNPESSVVKFTQSFTLILTCKSSGGCPEGFGCGGQEYQ